MSLKLLQITTNFGMVVQSCAHPGLQYANLLSQTKMHILKELS